MIETIFDESSYFLEVNNCLGQNKKFRNLPGAI